jgi:hypothetical protein
MIQKTVRSHCNDFGRENISRLLATNRRLTSRRIPMGLNVGKLDDKLKHIGHLVDAFLGARVFGGSTTS